MKYQRFLHVMGSFLAFLICFAGIRRHDVPENKYLKLAQQSQFDCVGQVLKSGKPSGSCVLIGGKFVLSAAHVFISHDFRLDTVEMQGREIIINVPYNDRIDTIEHYTFVFNGVVFHGHHLTIYPAYLDSATKGTCDLAVIELTESVPNLAPPRLNTVFDEMRSNVVGVGYGASGIANKPQSVIGENKKVAGENVVDSLSGYRLQGQPTLMVCDFDQPNNKKSNRMGSAIPRPLEYIASGGDSGGGLFRETRTGWELVGLFHATQTDIQRFTMTGYYGQIMQWTRVSTFANWIRDIVSPG